MEDSQALKPSFIKPPSDREVTEGHQVRFDCRVSGRPAPEVLWYRNGMQVCDDNAHKILVNEGGLHALQINDSQTSDAGLWTCVVRNKSGECRCDVNLKVVGKFAHEPEAMHVRGHTFHEAVDFTSITSIDSFKWYVMSTQRTTNRHCHRV